MSTAPPLPALRTDRRGAALVLALLMLVVLDCIVIGTLHLSLQEHRIGSNRALLLRLRLDAESGARRALAFWTARIDSMQTGSQFRIPIPDARTGTASVEVERLGDYLFLVRSTAIEPAPRVGRSAAQLLVTPPALPSGIDPAPAPLSANGIVAILPAGVVTAAAPSACAIHPSAAYSVLTTDPWTVVVSPGARLDAPVGLPVPRNVSSAFARIAALATPGPFATIAHADTTLAPDTAARPAAVLIVDGSLTIAAGVAFRGLIVTSGSITVETAASVAGAVHAGGSATIAGEIRWDRCEVDRAIDAADLTRPAPAGPRPWIPAF